MAPAIMRSFLDDNFLLDTETAVELYHQFATGPPIYDYHCHLPPAEIAENKRYESITDVWLGGDHYKWRAMRANGVSEELVTGPADPWDRFLAWAETVPATIGNPLYLWTHLELRRYFGIETILDTGTARRIYEKCNSQLESGDFRARRLMERMNVRLVCTTDDPVDDLALHESIARDDTFKIPVYPAFRPDKAFKTGDPSVWNAWIDNLATAAHSDISTLDGLLDALGKRVEYFHDRGCRTSDHGIEAPFSIASESDARSTFDSLRAGSGVDEDSAEGYAGFVMLALGRIYSSKGWVMQIHLGAARNNSRRMFERMGPDSGYDALSDLPVAKRLIVFLDELDSTGELPKTILYNLNPRDNELLAAAAGSFQDGKTPGKVQFGSGWWFNDQRDGMERQMTALANIGLLSRFVGMITDSRSFLSYPRHEYFRRVLCRMLGRWAEDGEIPRDFSLLSQLIGDVCFSNAQRYFGMEL